jgi:formylglycine-generating enzyme required for sulfatase activity
MRRVKALFGVLVLAIGVGLIGWLQTSYLRQRAYWFIGMRPEVITTASERELQPGNAFRECAHLCPELIAVRTGEFLMGSPETEKGRFTYEGPQRKIIFTKPFAVSKFELTFQEWDVCARDGGCAQVSDNGFGRGTQPVINVSRRDAQHYVSWLSRMTGQPYRLMSEAEWEYVARGGTQTIYFWGDEIGKRKANCNGCGSDWDRKQPAPVGSFGPNNFNLYDTTGNVWEWVEDCWHDSYLGNPPSDGAAWITECPDTNRGIVRGGSWRNGPQGLRIALRSWYPADGRHDALGFRIARTLSVKGGR